MVDLKRIDELIATALRAVESGGHEAITMIEKPALYADEISLSQAMRKEIA